MRKLLYIFFAFLTVLSVFQINTPKANAIFKCTLAGGTAKDSGGWSPPSLKSTKVNFPLSYEQSITNMPSEVEAFIKYEGFDPVRIHENLLKNGAGMSVNRDQHTIKIEEIRSSGNGAGDFYIGSPIDATGGKWRPGNYSLIIVPKGKNVSDQYCSVSFTVKPYCVISINGNVNDWIPGWTPSIRVTEFNPYDKGGVISSTRHSAYLKKDGSVIGGEQNTAGFMLNKGISFTSGPIEPGTYQFEVENLDDTSAKCKSNFLTIKDGGGSQGCTDNSQCNENEDEICLPASTNGGVRICGVSKDYQPGKIPLACKEKTKMVTNENGAQVEEGTGEFTCQTAVGEINTDPNNFAKSILGLVLSLAGMILLALLIINGYKLMTSQGDPEKIKDAREGIIAAIAGVLLIIFALSILRFITVDILGIPGFS